MSDQQRHTRTPAPAQTRAKARPDALHPGTTPARDALTSQPAPLELVQRLARAGSALATLGATLGLTPDHLARAEAIDRLELDTDLSLAALDAWDALVIAGWFVALGPDLRIDLTLSGGSQTSGATTALRAGRDVAQALTTFLDSAHQAERDSGDDVSVSLRLAVAKSRSLEVAATLLAQRPEYLGTPEMLARTKIAVFYSAAAFHRLIGIHALADWERLGLASEEGRTVVVLCDRSGYLAGVALEVLGAQDDAAPRWLALSHAGFRQFRQRAEQTRALREEEASWATAPRVLTPAHLRIATRAPGLEDTAAHLAQLQSALAAAYLADSAHTSAENDLLLRFAGPRPATCRIPAKTATAPILTPTSHRPSPVVGESPFAAESATAPVVSPSIVPSVSPVVNPRSPAESATDPLSSVPLRVLRGRRGESRISAESATASALARLCAWAYDNASPDKLVIARECLARELPHAAEIPLAAVESAAAGALDAAKANFTLYLRHNTEQYFSVRQKALDAVTTYAAAVRTSVSDLTSDVVDNVYRTAGLLVAVVIAALIQPSLSLGVARLAAAVYVLYIAFLVAFFMRARWRRFQLEQSALELHLAAMPELGAAERAALRQQSAAAERFFTTYFHRARWLYIGLGVAGLLIFLLLWTPLAPQTGLPHSSLPTLTPTLIR